MNNGQVVQTTTSGDKYLKINPTINSSKSNLNGIYSGLGILQKATNVNNNNGNLSSSVITSSTLSSSKVLRNSDSSPDYSNLHLQPSYPKLIAPPHKIKELSNSKTLTGNDHKKHSTSPHNPPNYVTSPSSGSLNAPSMISSGSEIEDWENLLESEEELSKKQFQHHKQLLNKTEKWKSELHFEIEESISRFDFLNSSNFFREVSEHHLKWKQNFTNVMDTRTSTLTMEIAQMQSHLHTSLEDIQNHRATTAYLSQQENGSLNATPSSSPSNKLLSTGSPSPPSSTYLTPNGKTPPHRTPSSLSGRSSRRGSLVPDRKITSPSQLEDDTDISEEEYFSFDEDEEPLEDDEEDTSLEIIPQKLDQSMYNNNNNSRVSVKR